MVIECVAPSVCMSHLHIHAKCICSGLARSGSQVEQMSFPHHKLFLIKLFLNGSLHGAILPTILNTAAEVSQADIVKAALFFLFWVLF